jgi:uncharacterized cupredoxin-like copper-binding protein
MPRAHVLLLVLLCPLAAQAAPKPRTVTVVMVDNRFVPDHVTFQSGQPTILRLENRGKEMHEFTAPDFLKASRIQDNAKLANGGTDIVVQPGQTVQVRLIPGAAGSYDLTCADHDWDGMVGSIKVQ